MWPKDIGGARTPILATFLHASSQPSHFLAIPPALEKEGESDPNIPILALRTQYQIITMLATDL